MTIEHTVLQNLNCILPLVIFISSV